MELLKNYSAKLLVTIRSTANVSFFPFPKLRQLRFRVKLAELFQQNFSPSAWHVRRTHFPDLGFPKRFAAGRRRGAGSARRPQENVLLLLVLVHGEELFLLGVKEPHDVPSFENLLLILSVLHEERDLPGGGRVDDVDFLAAGIVAELVVGGDVEALATGVDRLQDDLVADDDAVAVAAQLVKRHYVQPRALVAIRVQVHPHRVLLEQGGKSFVDGQEFVGLEM